MKAKGVNYRLVLKWIIPIMALVLLLCYQLAFKSTWKSFHEYQQLSELTDTDEAISVSPAYSLRREAGINELYKRYQVDTLKWKNRLWDQCAISSQRLDCSVQGFPAWKRVKYGDQVLITQEVIFKGSFHNLLKLEHALNTVKDIGLTGGLSFSKNEREKQTTLKIRLLGMQRLIY